MLYKNKPCLLSFCLIALCLGGLGSLSGCGKKGISQQDGAPKHIPKDLDKVREPIPKVEPLSKYGNRFKKNSKSYVALKRRYTVMQTSRGYRAKGLASWYGTKFHGRRTSSGEPYDMYSMTAAHRTLPLPTYAKVTNTQNGKSIIVKVNDRGPFHNNRLIDLSYAAAHRLGILGRGTGHVEVVSIDPRDHGGHVPGQKSGLFSRRKANQSASNQGTSNQNALNQIALNHSNAGASIDSEAVVKGIGANAGVVSGSKAFTNQKVRTPTLYLQMGAFRQKALAEKLRQEIGHVSTYPTCITTQQTPAATKGKQNTQALFRVRLGPFKNQQELQQAKAALAKAKLPTPIAVQ